MNNKFELHFCLNIEDDWPPVSVEGILVSHTADKKYRIETPPLFIKGLSVGDVIDAVMDSEKKVTSWQAISQSGRSTIWLLRMAEPSNIEKVLVELEKYGCSVINLSQFGCYSIDVPEDCNIKVIDECLAKLDESRVAIAYPSFRHPD